MSTLEEPLLPHPTAVGGGGAATPTILIRCTAILTFTALSIWANHEASKGIEISILNSAATTTVASRRFDLMFVSNGRAIRIIYTTTTSVENILYPTHHFPRKPVRKITLQLASHNLTAAVSVSTAGEGEGDYVVSLSPDIVMSEMATDYAVRRGVTLVWMWKGQGAAPPDVVDALATYLTETVGGAAGVPVARGEGRCWAAGGEFVRYCEEKWPGFVARMNRGMEGRWREGAVEEAVGSPAAARRLCAGDGGRSGGCQVGCGV